uniref:Liprin-beta-1-like n=1 Tax=Petromyzon marinus TaxID=7757 RepID=A0AAJ7TDQ7_PETMA|nr:liprin-beta-1-like [Petromyzon marinus]
MRISELRGSKAEYESLLQSTKSELAELRERLSLREDGEKLGAVRRNGATLGGQHGDPSGADEQQMKVLVASLLEANEKQERKISELQEMVQMVGLKKDGYTVVENPDSDRPEYGKIKPQRLHQLNHNHSHERNHVCEEQLGSEEISRGQHTNARRDKTDADQIVAPQIQIATEGTYEINVDRVGAEREHTSREEIGTEETGRYKAGADVMGMNTEQNSVHKICTEPMRRGEIHETQIHGTQMNGTQMNGGQIDLTHMSVSAEQIHREERATAQIYAEKTGAESRRMEHRAAEQMNREQIAAEQMNREQMNREQIAAEQMNREQMNREQIAAEQMNREQMNREQMNREQMNREQMNREQIATGQMGTKEVASQQMNRDEMGRAEINAGNVGTDQINAEQIAKGQIATDQIATGQIPKVEIATEYIATKNIAQERIATDQIGTGQIPEAEIATKHISTIHIAKVQIAKGQIAKDQVATDQIGASDIDTEQMNRDEMVGAQMNAGDLGKEQASAEHPSAEPSVTDETIANQPAADHTTTEPQGQAHAGQELTATGQLESVPLAPRGEEDARSPEVTGAEGTTEEEMEPRPQHVTPCPAGEGTMPDSEATPHGCSSSSDDDGDAWSPSDASAQVDNNGEARTTHAAPAVFTAEPRGHSAARNGDERGPAQARTDQAAATPKDGKFRMSLRRKASFRRLSLFKRRSQKQRGSELASNAGVAEEPGPSSEAQELLERISPATIHLRGIGSTDVPEATPSSPSVERKRRDSSFRRLLNKLRKTPSLGQNGDGLTLGVELRHRSFRAPHCRWSWALDPRASHGELETPFASWGVEQVCGWLSELGLGACVGLARQWVVRGDTLLRATPEDLEQELGLKNPLHRKKLTLALQALGSGEAVGTDALHHTWVMRWLDDVGLPQYKEQFHEARVDGRMLHYITTEDLLLLKVTNLLHHLSIKRAVQVLRLNHFQPDCFIRSAPEGAGEAGDVSRWPNERVMRWLRSVDLGEFAPNLRGSGVHGGLMIFEPRFSVETLASLLSIPPGKTLLRRHLSTSFSLLVGREAQRDKQAAADADGWAPLSVSARVKAQRRRGFVRGRQETKGAAADFTEYLCPMELGWGPSQGSPPESPLYGLTGTPLRRGRSQDELDCIDETGSSESVVRKLGEFSHDIENLTTSLLHED